MSKSSARAHVVFSRQEYQQFSAILECFHGFEIMKVSLAKCLHLVVYSQGKIETLAVRFQGVICGTYVQMHSVHSY